MKKESKIEWTSVSFKESCELNHWWVMQGIFNFERRFLMFCDKEINVWLEDLKTGKKIEVPMGAKSRGMGLALDIINKEEK